MILDLARLLLFPALLAFAAASDLFTMTISNRVSQALVAGFFVLALASGIFVLSVLANVQVTTDTGAWFFSGDLFMLAVILLLILWAFRTSMGDQKLWKADLLS